MKIIRKPLLDIAGNDLMTGNYNKEEAENNNRDFDLMISNQKAKAKKRISENSNNGKIFVEGFGLCNI